MIVSPENKTGNRVKNIIRYNLLITILQLLIFAILLFAIFFLKFKMEQGAAQNQDQSFVIEKNDIKLKFSNYG